MSGRRKLVDTLLVFEKLSTCFALAACGWLIGSNFSNAAHILYDHMYLLDFCRAAWWVGQIISVLCRVESVGRAMSVWLVG